MAKTITVKKQEGPITKVALIVPDPDKPDAFIINEVYFNLGLPSISEQVSHKYKDEEIDKAIKEMYFGIDDPRLPDDVKTWPVGKREDFVSHFNDDVYWYWRDEDPDYDVDQPEYVNAVRWAMANAYNYVEQHADRYEKTQNSQGGNEKKVQNIKADFVGFLPPQKIQAAKEGGYTVNLQIIEGGWTLNNEYFTPDSLADVAKLVSEKVPGYFNHGDMNRDSRDWSMVIESGWVEGNSVQGKAHIFQYPDGQALKERIDYVVDNEALHLFGVSIDGMARVEEGKKDGREGLIIKNMVSMHSVDVVMVPAANGRWGKRITQSVHKPINQKKEFKEMDLETLKREHPDLVSLVVREVQDELQPKIKELSETVDQGKVEKAKYEASIADLAAKVKEYEDKESKNAFECKVEKYVKDNLDARLVTKGFVDSLKSIGEDKWNVIEQLVSDRKESASAKGPKGMGDVGEGATDKNTSVDEDERLNLFQSQLR